MLFWSFSYFVLLSSETLLYLFPTSCLFATLCLNCFGLFLYFLSSDDASCWLIVMMMTKSKTSRNKKRCPLSATVTSHGNLMAKGWPGQPSPAREPALLSWLCPDSILLLLQVLHPSVHQTLIGQSSMQRKETSPKFTNTEEALMYEFWGLCNELQCLYSTFPTNIPRNLYYQEVIYSN